MAQGEHSGGQIGDLAGSTTGADHTGPVSATVANTHKFVISVAIMTVFVVVMTAIAGTGPASGHAIVLVMLALLFLQGLAHVNPVTQFVANHNLVP
jgi:hypothetical protein